MNMVGHNTVSGELLTSFVERLEKLREEKREVGGQEKAVMAEAGAAGFQPKIINRVIKLRAMKPHDRDEIDSLTDNYLHALGMARDTPFLRHVATMSVDITSREAVIEALKAFVPENGSIVVEAGGKPMRLTRDSDGDVSVSEVVKPKPSAGGGEAGPSMAAPASGREPPPDVDAAGAEALGAQAFRDNVAIVKNPFPFGDARRPRWDEGWRRASGSDGMGKP